MGWLRLVGSLKLQGSFAKEPYTTECILQKRPIILRRVLMVATLSQRATDAFSRPHLSPHCNFKHLYTDFLLPYPKVDCLKFCGDGGFSRCFQVQATLNRNQPLRREQAAHMLNCRISTYQLNNTVPSCFSLKSDYYVLVHKYRSGLCLMRTSCPPPNTHTHTRARLFIVGEPSTLIWRDMALFVGGA